jgi:hypothetical protein
MAGLPAIVAPVLAEYEALEQNLRDTNTRLRDAISKLHAQIQENMDEHNVASGRERSDDGRGKSK